MSPLLGRRHRRPRTEHRRAISISHIDADHAERRDSSHEPALYIRLALTLEPEQRSKPAITAARRRQAPTVRLC